MIKLHLFVDMHFNFYNINTETYIGYNAYSVHYLFVYKSNYSIRIFNTEMKS